MTISDMVLTQVRATLQEGRLDIVLDRPERRNAITTVMLAELLLVLEAATLDKGVRVVVISGAGKGFCAGDDLRGMGPLPDDFTPRPYRQTNHAELQHALRELAKPVVAVLHGFAFGVGLDLAMACDFRIASADAQLRDQRVMERGMHAVTGCAWFHPRAIGVPRALEFLILGEPLSGAQARELGMVTRAVAEADLEAEVDRFAARLAVAPTRAIGLMKEQIYKGEDMTHEAFMAYAAPLIQDVEIRDRAEGIAAFLEKRTAHFTGE